MKRRGQGLLIAIGSGKSNREKEDDDDETDATDDDESEAACDEAAEALIEAVHAKNKDEVKEALRAFLAAEEY